MNTIKFLLGFIFAFNVLSVGSVFADEPRVEGKMNSGKERWEKRVHKVFDQLELTPEQKTALEANKHVNKEAMRADFEKMRSLRESFNQELMKPDLDMAKINAIHSDLKTLQSQMADRRLSSVLEVRKILTPEQFSKFISFMDKRKDRSKGPRAEGDGPGHEDHENNDATDK